MMLTARCVSLFLLVIGFTGSAAASNKSLRGFPRNHSQGGFLTESRFVSLPRTEIFSRLRQDPSYARKKPPYDWAHLKAVLIAIEDRVPLQLDVAQFPFAEELAAMSPDFHLLSEPFIAADVGIMYTEKIEPGSKPIEIMRTPVALRPDRDLELNGLTFVTVGRLQVVGR